MYVENVKFLIVSPPSTERNSMSSKKGAATPGPVIIAILAIFAWPIIVIAGLLYFSERLKTSTIYAGIIATSASAIACTYLGISAYAVVGFVVFLISLFTLVLNLPLPEDN